MPDFTYIKEDTQDNKGTVKIAPPTPPDHTPPVTLVTLTVEGTVIAENLTVKGKINEGQTWYEVLPARVIMMWYGDAGQIPKGWAICDGSEYRTIQKESRITWHKKGEKLPDGWTECIDPNLKTTQTPDLRGRFVMGADDNSEANQKNCNDYIQKKAALSQKQSELTKATNDYNQYIDEQNKKEGTQKKHWGELTPDEQKRENSELANKIITAKTNIETVQTELNDFYDKNIKNKPNLERAILSKGETGGVHPMKKEPHVSGSGLDMSKAGYISEIDYPPYMALYYIMKL